MDLVKFAEEFIFCAVLHFWCSELILAPNLVFAVICRDVFRTHTKIYDGGFLRKITQRLSVVNIFLQKSSIIDVWQGAKFFPAKGVTYLIQID